MKLLLSFINISLGIHGLLFSKRYTMNMNQHQYINNIHNINTNNKNYPLSRTFHNKYLNRIGLNNTNNSYTERKNEFVEKYLQKRQNKYPHSVAYYEKFVKRLNSKSITQEISNITNHMDEIMNDLIGNLTEFEKSFNEENGVINSNGKKNKMKKQNMRIIINGPNSNQLFNQLFGDQLSKQGYG